MRPVIALAMGDPAGISPELTAKLLTLDEVVDKARIVVIGDLRVLDHGGTVLERDRKMTESQGRAGCFAAPDAADALLRVLQSIKRDHK